MTEEELLEEAMNLWMNDALFHAQAEAAAQLIFKHRMPSKSTLSAMRQSAAVALVLARRPGLIEIL